jgi:hypothetical protein
LRFGLQGGFLVTFCVYWSNAMSIQHRKWVIFPIVGLIAVTMACALPGAIAQTSKTTATPTPNLSILLPSLAGTSTPTVLLPAGASNGVIGSSSGSNGSTGGNSAGTGGNSGGTGGNSSSSIENPPTQLPDINTRPYLVQQVETLGGEAISGVVCSLSQPFSVLSVTPHVTFSFYFVPKNTQNGTVSYAYTIKSAGESHNANGTYSLNQIQNDGTLQLSMTVSDHVTFKGFDGNIPNHYKFNLVPSGNTSCP